MAFSHLKRLDLRKNNIVTLPTFAKPCNMLRFLEFLDLGGNRLRLIPTSFILSISKGDGRQGADADHSDNSAISMGDMEAVPEQNRLKVLLLDNNQLETIPAEIAELENL